MNNVKMVQGHFEAIRGLRYNTILVHTKQNKHTLLNTHNIFILSFILFYQIFSRFYSGHKNSMATIIIIFLIDEK